MELYQLKSFVSVAREGNLSRAAVKLFTSQPALSAQIKALEESLGVVLFERTPKGMLLTPPGRTLFAEAEKALAAAQGVLQQAKRLRGELEGVLRLGTIASPIALRLGEFLSRLSAGHPKLDIELTQGVSGTVAQGVLKQDLDAGYVIGPIDESLECDALGPVTLCVAVPKTMAGSLHSDDWEMLAALPWVGTPTHCSFNRLSRELFAAMGRTPRMVASADQEATLLALVSQGIGASLLREDQAREAEQRGQLAIWGGTEVKTTLGLVYRKDHMADPMLEAVREVARQTWGLS
jgi:DNA-binding transcriptional LysR family regulator